MRKQPVTFVEWRKVYHSALYNLGISADYYFKAKWRGDHAKRVIEAREIFEQIRRMDRINKRLNATTYDVTWCQSLLKTIFEDKNP